MPRVAFAPENKAESPFDYPKLFLEKGERARIILIEEKPEMEYVHTMRAPQIINGEVKTEIVKQFGKEVEAPVYDFIGRHICIGNYEIIAKKGLDADGCPVCQAATESDAVKAPDRRFALHVMKYALKPGSFECASPLQVQCVAWTFTDRTFNTITDFAAEWGDLRKHDLLLGPCENRQFQKFDIQVAAKAVWLENPEWKKLVADTYRENKSEDLAPLIGRKLTREVILEDLERVMHRHNLAFKGGTPQGDTAPEVADQMALEDLLGGGTPAASAPAPTTTTTVEDVPAAEPAATTPDVPASADVPPSADAVNFDDLLNDL